MQIFIIAILLGLIPASIAKKKGYSFAKWWFYGAMLFIVALPAALLLKPNEKLRECPKCAELVKEKAKVCKHCGNELEPVLEEEKKRLKRINQKEGHIPTGLAITVILGAIAYFIWLGYVSCNNPNSEIAKEYLKLPNLSSEHEEKPTLEIISWRVDNEYSLLKVRGEIKNLSDQKQENVIAVVDFRNKEGILVKTGEMLIRYNPLMPGQTSSFEVTETYTPEIKKYNLYFHDILGRDITSKMAKEKE